ncbi:flavin reductase family protein [Sphingomonas sp. OTU376]|uniref:flavin reductase family protein n=1 Tax=Sphingomonas sp. OTU376 TaxID=3043863 RepID=UPI00313CBB1E
MRYDKKNFPVIRSREHLETGPVILVTSSQSGRSNVMTMGWHTMMQFSPALVGFYLWEGNRSHEAVRQTRQCVINIPTADIVEKVITVGNMHADGADKLKTAGLTAIASSQVEAPQIAECYASFECRLFEDRLVEDYSFFVWEIVRAWVNPITAPRTLHYRGQGKFMIAGEEVDYAERFQPENL